jgi:hypothetical protein
MVQFLDQQALQALGRLAFGGIDSRLGQEPRCIEVCLHQQLSEAGIRRLQCVVVRTAMADHVHSRCDADRELIRIRPNKGDLFGVGRSGRAPREECQPPTPLRRRQP